MNKSNNMKIPSAEDQWQKKPRMVMKNPNKDQKFLSKSLRGRMSR